MSVRIRLARIGKKKAPFFKIVAVDKRKKRDGQYLENLGTYNPLTGEIVQFHAEKIQAWLEKGAIPSETVIRIKKQHARGQVGPKRKVVAPKKKKTEEAPAVEAAPKIEKAPEAQVEAQKEQKVQAAEEKKVEDKKEVVKEEKEKTEDTSETKE